MRLYTTLFHKCGVDRRDGNGEHVSFTQLTPDVLSYNQLTFPVYSTSGKKRTPGTRREKRQELAEKLAEG